jgi:hypothetical protein
MTQPVSKYSCLPVLFTVQEEPRCDICQKDKVIKMLFYIVYGKSFSFCSETCLKTWVFKKENK